MKKIVLAAGCLLLAGTAAHAADDPNNEAIRLQLQQRAKAEQQAQVRPDEEPALLRAMNTFRHENRIQVRNMIREAQQQDLPTEPLTAKVMEGVAKNVPEDKIVRAVEQVRNRYENAYRHARRLADDAEQAEELGQVIADAFAAGLSEEDCEAIMTQLRQQQQTRNQQEEQELRVRTMEAVRTMTRLGVASSTASDVVVKALRQQYQAREMRTLQESIARRARYTAPEDAARGYASDMGGKGAGGGTGSGSGNSSGTGGAGSSGDGGGSGSSGGSSGSGSSGGSSGSGSSGGSSGSGSSGGSSGSGSSGGSSGSGSSGGAGGSSGGSGSGSGGSGGSGRGR